MCDSGCGRQYQHASVVSARNGNTMYVAGAADIFCRRAVAASHRDTGRSGRCPTACAPCTRRQTPAGRRAAAGRWASPPAATLVLCSDGRSSKHESQVTFVLRIMACLGRSRSRTPLSAA